MKPKSSSEEVVFFWRAVPFSLVHGFFVKAKDQRLGGHETCVPSSATVLDPFSATILRPRSPDQVPGFVNMLRRSKMGIHFAVQFLVV